MTGRQRLFIAVWPPADVVERLARLPRPPDPALRWSIPEQWHVTLRFLGGVGEEDRDRLAAAFHRVDAGALAPIVAELGPVTRRFGDRVLQVPVAGLDRLAAAVVAATTDIGRPPDDRSFRGHVTLARARRKGFDLRALAGEPVSASWTVEEMMLVVSHTRPDGARYEVVDRRAVVGETPGRA